MIFGKADGPPLVVRNRAVLSGLNLCVADGPPEDSGQSGFAGQKSDRNWADSDGLIKSTEDGLRGTGGQSALVGLTVGPGWPVI